MIEPISSSENLQSAIRTSCKNLRARITPKERQQASEIIANKILKSELFADANDIAIYIPLKPEVDTWPFIERAFRLKKRIFAPIVQKDLTLRFRQLNDESRFSTNKMGLRQPTSGKFIEADELELVITPLVAFDSQKNRIGMGGGCYDRTFSFLEQRANTAKPILAGLAFDRQRVDRIAANPWDIRLSSIFTECGEW